MNDILNLKEVAETVLKKHVEATVARVNNSQEIGTEKTIFFEGSAQQIGENFENFPYPISKIRDIYFSTTKTMEFINEKGEVVQEVPNSEAYQFTGNHGQDKRDFKFTMKDNEIIVAIKQTSYFSKDNSESKHLIFLSQPFYAKDIKAKREAYYHKIDSAKIERDIEAIETIWK